MEGWLCIDFNQYIFFPVIGDFLKVLNESRREENRRWTENVDRIFFANKAATHFHAIDRELKNFITFRKKTISAGKNIQSQQWMEIQHFPL